MCTLIPPATQFFCLLVLTGVYFAGLLLKTQAMAQDSGIGVLLVTMLVSVVVATFALHWQSPNFALGSSISERFCTTSKSSTRVTSLL
jgi:hypothetical protein